MKKGSFNDYNVLDILINPAYVAFMDTKFTPIDKDAFLVEILGEPVEKEIVVYLNDNWEPVEKDQATQVRIVLFGKTKRYEVYGYLNPPSDVP